MVNITLLDREIECQPSILSVWGVGCEHVGVNKKYA